MIFSVDYMHGEHQLGRYYAFVLFFIGAMVGLVLTSNLLLMFVFWGNYRSLFLCLIAFHNDDPKAVAGGVKALIITQFGGVGLLLGAVLLVSTTGSYDIDTALLASPSSIPAGTLAVLAYGFLVAAAAKSAQFPSNLTSGCNGSTHSHQRPDPCGNVVNAGVYLWHVSSRHSKMFRVGRRRSCWWAW